MKPLLRIAAALVCWTVAPAWSWDTVLPGDGEDGNGASLAVRADGDVIVTHCVTRNDPDHEQSRVKTIERLSGATGTQAWRTAVERSGYCSNPSVIVTAEGDPIVSQPLQRLSGESGSVVWSNDADNVAALAMRGDDVLIITSYSTNYVAALDAQTGDTLWTHPLDLRPGYIAIQPSGDVVVTAYGHGTSQPPPNPFAVIALDGTTGAERWRYTAFGTADYINWNSAGAIAIDPAGDVVAGGFLANLITPVPPAPRDYDTQPFVVKLSGDTGAELWSRLVLLPPGDAYVQSLAIAPDGDAVVGINHGGLASPEIVRLAASTGAERWRAAWQSNPQSANGDYLQRVAMDAAGDVIALGSSYDRVAVGRYAGSTGQPLWLRSLVSVPDPLHDQAFAEAMVLGAENDVVIAGSVMHWDTFKLRLHVIGFREAVAGQRLLVRDNGTRRTVRVVFRDPHIQPALVGGPGDPQLDGASLTLQSSAGGAFTFPLSAEGWAPIGARGGFTYQGADDGCTVVRIKPGVLRARCTTTDGGFTLAQPMGEVAVRLTIATPVGFSQCTTFGGTVLADRAVTAEKSGRFEAVDAPAPAGCD